MKNTLEIVQKSFLVGYAHEWGESTPTESVFAQSPGKAKSKFDNYNGLPFVEIKAVRNKDEDWVLFEGRKMKRYAVVMTLRDREYRKTLENFVANNQGQKVLIYSGQWGLYWRSGGEGYTQSKAQAGVYEINDAWSRVSHCGSEKAISFILVS